jgi:Wiskott-Aldrich syndrome protein
MISAPALHSFVHIAHVGINDDGAIEASEGVDPSWKAVLSGLHDGTSSREMVVPDGHTSFVDGFWKGVDTRDRKSNSSETTMVDTTSNGSKFPYGLVVSLT